MTQESRKPMYRSRPVLLGGALAAGAIAALMIWRSQPEAPPASAPAVAPQLGAAGPPPPPPPPSPGVPPDPDGIRERAQRTLRASLEEAGSAARAEGSSSLGKLHDARSVPALIALTETDPDDEVRGHAAEALGRVGAPVAPRLAKLEVTASPLLKVSYASALARLGDREARTRLLAYARSNELAVALRAGLRLAEVSPPGDKAVIAALKALAAHEAELDKLVPNARALIWTRMAALHDANARKVLYALLEDPDEGTRLAAAEGLAKLGDDAGRKALQEVLANPASPRWLAAVLASIPLGERGDLDRIVAKLADKDPGTRRLAARALGALGDRRGVSALLAHANDPDASVRVAVAAATVAIVELEPQALARTSVDWVKHALFSQDRAERAAAAGVLADVPEKIGLRLLAKASVDPDPGVRRVVAESAGKMRSAGAAAVMAAAVAVERDPAVKEQQVKALGQIGSPTVGDTLARITEQPGRIAVLAAGSQLAIGDPRGLPTLEAAIASPQVELRLAAVQAASASKNPGVIPLLKIGVMDHVFEIRFTAAEGLSLFKAEAALAVPVLTAGLDSRDDGVVGRALAALLRFGKTLVAKVQRPADMLDSPDPRRRLAAVPIVHVLPVAESVSLLRRLVADQDRDVRYAGVEAIGILATRDPAQAVELYTPLVHDADPVVRAKAKAQLARLAPPWPGRTIDPLLEVRRAYDEAVAAAAAARTAAEDFASLADTIARKTAAPSPEAGVIRQCQELAAKLDPAVGALAAAAARTELASQDVVDAAGERPSPAVAKLVGEAKQLAQAALDAAAAARGKQAYLAGRLHSYLTHDIQVLLDGATALIATGNLAEAQQRLDRAASLLQKSKAKHPGLEYLYAQLHDRMSARAEEPQVKCELLAQAAGAYQRFAEIGTGPQLGLANARMAEISDELKESHCPDRQPSGNQS